VLGQFRALPRRVETGTLATSEEVRHRGHDEKGDEARARAAVGGRGS
jgi:hypothetical protein